MTAITRAVPADARPVSGLSMLSAQIRAGLRATFRNPGALVPTLLFPIMFWSFFGLPNAHQTIGGISVGAYVLSSFAVYSIIQTVLFTLTISIANERATGWYRYLRTTPVRVWVLFTAKLINVLVLGLLALGLSLAFGAVTGDISLSAGAWLSLVARVLVGALPFAALAIFIGYFARDVTVAQPIISLIFFPMSFASGLFLPLEQLPAIVRAIAPFLPAYHGGQLARVAVGVPSASGDWVHLACLLGFMVVFLVMAVWAFKRDEGTNYR